MMMSHCLPDKSPGCPAAAPRLPWPLVRTLFVATLLAATNPAADAAERVFSRDDAGYTAIVVPFFRKHCADCHVGEKPEGEFSIAKKDLGTDFTSPLFRNRWREIVNVLNAHEMPPKDEEQPSASDVANVVDWITKQAVAAEFAKREGAVVLRRLNRAEYRNTIRDLVGVDFDISAFPQDPPAGGFDNNGGALSMSPLQMELYLSAAEQIVDQAIVAGPRPEEVRWRFDPRPGPVDSVRVRLDDHNNPLVNGGSTYEGDWTVIRNDQWDKTPGARDFRVPVAGTYVIRARLAGRRPSRDDVIGYVTPLLEKRKADDDARNPQGAPWHEKALADALQHFRTDRMYDFGPPRLKLTLGLGSQPRTVAEFDVEGSPESPQIVEFPVQFTTESAGMTLSYAYSIPSVPENQFLQHAEGFPRPEALVDWFEIEGPVYDAWPPSSHTKILFDSPRRPDGEAAYAREVLERFMAEAYRRPVTADEVGDKVALFDAARERQEPFLEAIKRPLVAVLSSPDFLYLPEGDSDADPKQLTGHDLAARMSYFLWSSQPDAELRRLADAGKLADPATRREQADRMLADPKSDALVENFAGQWLGLRDVGANPPAPDLYPQYDRHLERSIAGETKAFFREFLRSDLDVRGMLASDFVTINERLARFYGIPGVRGDAFQKVTVPRGVSRGGLVTQASVLTITSNGTRTSPVKRGTWILKTLLGTDPGLPVANAGEISPQVPGIDKATVRQRLEIHRQLKQCARCHDKIDPLGFALENFNAAGDWREREGFGYRGRIEPNDPPIDASARMPDGTRIVGVAGLQKALLEQDELFLKSLATHLMTYALGRELGLADQPSVQAAVATMKSNASGAGPTLRALIKAIVASETFATK